MTSVQVGEVMVRWREYFREIGFQTFWRGLVMRAGIKYCCSNQLQVEALGGVMMTPPTGRAPGTLEKHRLTQPMTLWFYVAYEQNLKTDI